MAIPFRRNSGPVKSSNENNTFTTDTSDTQPFRFVISADMENWSNPLWITTGIQFARCATRTGLSKLVFLVQIYKRAGCWFISYECIDGESSTTKRYNSIPRALPSTNSTLRAEKCIRVNIVIDNITVSMYDDEVFHKSSEKVFLGEVLRFFLCNVRGSFLLSNEFPESAAHNGRLGYLEHVNHFCTCFFAVEDIEIDHFIQDCNFPVSLYFSPPARDVKMKAKTDIFITQFDENNNGSESILLKKLISGNGCLALRIIFAETNPQSEVLSYLHSVDIEVSPLVIQVLLLNSNAIHSHTNNSKLCRLMMQ